MAVRLRVVIAVFIITGLVLISSTVLTYWFGNRVLQSHAREEVRREVIVQLGQLLSAVKDAETGQRGFVITGDERYLSPYQDAVKRLPTIVEKFKSMPRIDISAADVNRVVDLIDRKMTELRKTVELRRNSGFDPAAALIRSDEGRHIMEQLRSEIAGLQARKTAALEADRKRSDQATRTRTIMFAGTGLINILVLAWAYQRITQSIKLRDEAITQAGRSSAELRQQKDLLGVTLSSIGDCVLVTDKEGRVDFMNPVAEKVTGWTFAEARGRPTAEIFHILNAQTRKPVDSPVEKVMRQGVIVGLGNHTILIRKDGTEIPIDDSGAPIRDANGALRGVVLVFRDFSEHRQVERELREAKQEAETANKTKDRFLAMLSHELRTPLTPVLATLDLWQASEDVPEAMRPDVQMLRRSVELEARIIDDLLDLTRIARGMLSFSPENTDVHALVEFLVGLSRSEIEGKQLKATLKLNAARHHVYTDAARLQQVLWNVLRNAIKFTEVGNISITTSNDARGNIDILINDTGIGMTAETLSRLFVPFEQADRAHSTRYGGLGLGMAISSAIVELLDGKLTATSPGPGRGSTFTITFPTTAPSTGGHEPEMPSPLDSSKLKLLLIEDHADTARALVRLLGSRGYNITSLATVASALEVAGRENFDVFLCDIGLPDGTGFDFIEKIRQTRQTPAIALTGFGMQQDIERAQRAGFDAHLTKPVNLQKLEATIWRLVQDRT
jgi:PAS domain S-box-containing protein